MMKLQLYSSRVMPNYFNKIIPIFLIFTTIPYCCLSCVATASSGVPIGCCPPLTQTVTNNTQFADGIMTFVYDNNNCRTQVTATCSQPNPQLLLNAAIVANSVNFLSVGSTTTSFPGFCDANNQWDMGNPPLVIQTLECLLTNPTNG